MFFRASSLYLVLPLLEGSFQEELADSDTQRRYSIALEEAKELVAAGKADKDKGQQDRVNTRIRHSGSRAYDRRISRNHDMSDPDACTLLYHTLLCYTILCYTILYGNCTIPCNLLYTSVKCIVLKYFT